MVRKVTSEKGILRNNDIMINHNMELKDEPNDSIRNTNYSVIWYKQYTHIVFRKDIWQPKFSFSPFSVYLPPHQCCQTLLPKLQGPKRSSCPGFTDPGIYICCMDLKYFNMNLPFSLAYSSKIAYQALVAYINLVYF
jgi:hypothetical protein